MLRDLRPKFSRTVGVAAAISWMAATAASFWLLRIPFWEALLMGLMLCLMHWLALFIHHLGHAFAARSIGAPMTGVRLWWWLGTSLYPRDETPLPPSAHMRRARSGPIASVLFALITSALVLIVPLEGSLIWVAVLFVALDSLLVFGLGSLIPLGFNDGSTLLEWSSRRR